MSNDIVLERVDVQFKRVHALRDLSETITGDTVTGLVGRNGAGKTTLLRVIAGREPRFDGQVRVADAPVGRPGLVHFALDRWSWAGDQTIGSLIGHHQRLFASFDADRARQLIARFWLLPSVRIGALSLGQSSAVRACIALATRAPITLLDEPHLGLDAPSRALFAELVVEEIELQPRTLVISTHLIDETAPLFERLLVLDAGLVLAHDDVTELLARFVRVEGDADALGRLPLQDSHRLGRRVTGIVARSDSNNLPAGTKVSPLGVQELAGILPQLAQGGSK